MKLSFEQIRTITVGAVRMSEETDGIHFHKCTEKQVAAWENLAPILGERARTTTGVRLDFHTDSRSMTFTTASGNKFEVYINGVVRHRFKVSELDDRSVTVALNGTLGEELTGDRRVTLCLPSHEVGVLTSLELEDGAYVKPHSFDCKMLFIGDSITQGWDSGYDSLSYAYRTSFFFNAESVIHGVGGGYFHESVFDSIDFDPDAVILAFGTNDFGHYKTQEEMRQQTRAFMDRIAEEYAGKKIFALSPIWREVQQKSMGSFAECRQIVIDEAVAHGMIHIDGLSLMPPIPVFYADKNLHPDALGFSLYAENLCRELLPYLK